jgi:hypothetical protein
MNIIDLIGSVGVTVLLLAFFLNIFDIISKSGHAYIWMNFAGAALACCASLLIHYLPFVILEGVWSLVSAVAIAKKYLFLSA